MGETPQKEERWVYFNRDYSGIGYNNIFYIATNADSFLCKRKSKHYSLRKKLAEDIKQLNHDAALYAIEKFINDIKTDYKDMAVFGYLLLIIFICSVYMQRIYQYRKVYIRVYFKIFFWLFLLSFIFFFYPMGAYQGMIYIIVLPASYLTAAYFIGAEKSFVNRMLFLSGLVLAILIQINDFFGII